MENFLPVEIIRKTRDGNQLSKSEIKALIDSYCQGHLPDYQMASWLMAVFLKGLQSSEIHHLTEAMIQSGKSLDFSDLQRPVVDKHSTGGVGDKTSIILGPMVASLGIAVPMIAGRGLGHTGGTLDKLESIPGFQTRLEEQKFVDQIRNLNICFMGQTESICPADKKIYALRDVTGTVESIPLISASIMSKKIAEGIESLVLDVKCGSGAFMKTQIQAERLAQQLLEVGRASELKMRVLITDMGQPLGQMVGNSLEIEECLEILRGNGHKYQDTLDLTLRLGAEMVVLSFPGMDLAQATQKLKQSLSSGRAYEVFEKVCRAQGGDLSRLPKATYKKEVLSSCSGYLSFTDTEYLGYTNIFLKAGRIKSADSIDPSTGIQILVKIGERVEKGSPLAVIHYNSDEYLEEVKRRIMKSLVVDDSPIKELPKLILKVL